MKRQAVNSPQRSTHTKHILFFSEYFSHVFVVSIAPILIFWEALQQIITGAFITEPRKKILNGCFHIRALSFPLDAYSQERRAAKIKIRGSIMSKDNTVHVYASHIKAHLGNFFCQFEISQDHLQISPGGSEVSTQLQATWSAFL